MANPKDARLRLYRAERNEEWCPRQCDLSEKIKTCQLVPGRRVTNFGLKGTGRRPSVGGTVDSIGIANPGLNTLWYRTIEKV